VSRAYPLFLWAGGDVEYRAPTRPLTRCSTASCCTRFLTADAVRQAVDRIRNACAGDDGRDPDQDHICHPIVVAPELDELTTRAYAQARAVTYLEWPGHGEALCNSNLWDASRLTKLREHKQFKTMDGPVYASTPAENAALIDAWRSRTKST
jgi:5,10-methylenetetrahydromethanopterin reductase